MAGREIPIVELGNTPRRKSRSKKQQLPNSLRDEVYLILHNIRSAHNVGAIFRTADAIGVAKIYLTGYTPAPLDRFGSPRKDIAKSALGAEKVVPWEQSASPSMLVKKLKKEKVFVAGLEQSARSQDYKKFRAPGRIALILGNEVLGISKPLQALCDALVEIPMRGGKESLNVSVAAGIALFRLFDR
jgi:tRNA G18 (ribose-2'-O)-methylase SpoU